MYGNRLQWIFFPKFPNCRTSKPSLKKVFIIDEGKFGKFSQVRRSACPNTPGWLLLNKLESTSDGNFFL